MYFTKELIYFLEGNVVLVRNKCYILAYFQRPDPCGEEKHIANILFASNTIPFSNRLYNL